MSKKAAKRQEDLQSAVHLARFASARTFPVLPALPDEALADLAATAFLPFSIVSSPSFVNFVEVVQRHPKWKPPHRYTLSTSGVDSLYHDVVKSVCDIASNCKKQGSRRPPPKEARRREAEAEAEAGLGRLGGLTLSFSLSWRLPLTTTPLRLTCQRAIFGLLNNILMRAVSVSCSTNTASDARRP